jgi:hypothetical protein
MAEIHHLLPPLEAVDYEQIYGQADAASRGTT